MKRIKNNGELKKKKRSALLAFSALTIAAALSLSVPSITSQAGKYSYLDNITSDSIKEKEKEVAEAKAQKAEIENKKSDIVAIRNELEQQKNDLSAYITELDAAMEQIQYNIADLEDQILLKEADIFEAEEELENARAEENEQYDNMVIRMRKMYERNNAGLIASLLKSKNFSDFLNRMNFIEDVVSYDRSSWEELKNIRQYVELCEQQLEMEKENLSDALDAVETERENMELLIEEKEKQLTEYMQSIAESQQQIDSLETQIDSADDEIALLEQAILTEKQQLYAQQNLLTTYDGGAFVLPVARYRYVSSKYGYRVHPIFGTTKFHSGVDLAADYGVEIYAAYKGVVASAGYNSSMGNYVMINHGGGLYTIYMHASSLSVKEGDVVTTGQKIAAVGSTGNSTGNHLHFSVRKDGEYVDPNDYYYFYAR